MTPEQEICMLRQEIRSLEYKNRQLHIALSVLKVQYGALLDQFTPDKLKSVYISDEQALQHAQIDQNV